MSNPAETMQRRMLEMLSPIEASAFVALRPLLRALGQGDQHPVLVLPGFGAGDHSTVPMRWAIRGQGYWVHAWRLGANVGPTRKVVDGLRTRIEELRARHDRTITIIGWSLGGIIARELARQSPEHFRRVITLGSPYRKLHNDRFEGAHVRAPQMLYDRLSRRHVPEFEIMRIAEHEREPLTVPATSIYSRHDTFAPWPMCIDATGPDAPNPRAENIEVITSHLGLGSNLSVLTAVLDRLAQPEDQWAPFEPPLGFRWLYPAPATWLADRQRRTDSSEVSAGRAS
jgi:hypothetical protein